MLRVGGWANIQVVDVSQDTYEGAWYEQNNKTLETYHERNPLCKFFFRLEKVGKRQNASKFESFSISVTLLGRLLWPQQYLSYFTVSVYSPIHQYNEIQFYENSEFFERIMKRKKSLLTDAMMPVGHKFTSFL